MTRNGSVLASSEEWKSCGKKLFGSDLITSKTAMTIICPFISRCCTLGLNITRFLINVLSALTKKSTVFGSWAEYRSRGSVKSGFSLISTLGIMKLSILLIWCFLWFPSAKRREINSSYISLPYWPGYLEFK